MPELPDLEVMARHLDKRLSGHVLKSVAIGVKNKVHASAESLNDAVVGHKLKKVYREGKELRLAFTNEQILGLHLMLHGKLQIGSGQEEVKHSIIGLDFGKDRQLVLSDFQKMANVTLNPERSEVKDALDVDDDYISALLGKKKGAVKAVFLDQHFIRGIGNAYADEIFYDAGISPFSAGNKIPPEALSRLVKSIRKVLKNATAQILKADPERITGENRDFMKVHLPGNKQAANGEEILMKKQGARKTYYVESQKLYQ